MTAPISSVSGIVSGINFKDLVDQIIQSESGPLTRLQNESASIQDQLKAFTTYRGLLDKLKSAASVLRDGSALDATTATTTVVTGTRALATVTTDATAIPGSYSLKVTQLARAAKLGSTSQADTTTALGLAGTFTVNGVSVTVTAADSLGAIRDKINAVNTGASASKVSASILSVGTADQRLVLAADKTGANGLVLADTTGTVLQSLGYLDASEAPVAGATLVPGKDALFSIDGVSFQRASNVVSDAVQGVTFTLTGEDPAAETSIVVGRYGDSADSAIKTFVDAYNGVVAYLKAQSTATDTSRPVLYNDSLIRGVRSGLPTRLLQTVLGAAPDLATASSVGISFARDGTLAFDATKFDAAFQGRYQDVRNLFTERRSATNAAVTLVSGGGNTASGTYGVDITAAATQAVTSTSGFSGTYDAGATPDQVTVTDSASGKSATVTLTTGMTSAQIRQAFADAFTANGVGIAATLNGNDVVFTQQLYGTGAKITVTNANAGDGASELWTTTPLTVAGTDVAGTIGGNAATGTGQTLVASPGTPGAGVTVSYTGTTTGAQGTVTLALGVGALIERMLDGYLATSSGTIAQRETALGDRSSSLDARAAEMQKRLDQRKQNLLSRFTAMEVAIAKLQKQSSALGNLTQFGGNQSK